MTEPIRGLSSMATKELLADVSAALRGRGSTVVFESAGGTEVARGIRTGVRADLAVLSDAVMSDLDAEGLLQPGTLRPLFVSDVVAAVPDGVPAMSLATEDDLKAALLDADGIAYSTGPSGEALVDLISRWGLGDALRPKLVQAGPGTPVAALLAGGAADLGFQQRSELSQVAGIRLLGALPGTAAIHSTFSGAVLARSTNPYAAREVLDFLRSPDVEHLVRAARMELA